MATTTSSGAPVKPGPGAMQVKAPDLRPGESAPSSQRPSARMRGEDDENRFKPISMALVWRLLSWLKPYRKLYAIGALCGIVSLGCELVTPSITQRIIDVAIPSGEMWNVLKLAEIWAGLWVVALFCDSMQLGATTRCGESVIRDIRMAVFTQLQRLSMSFYDRTKLGRIITRGTSDLDSLRGPVVNGINTVALNALLMVGSGIMILRADWRLFLAVAWLAPVLTFCNHIYRQKIGVSWQLVRATYSRMTANLAENITGVRVVSAYNRQDENLELYNQLQEENTANNLRSAKINGIYQPLLEFFRFLGQVICLAYGGALVMQDSALAVDNPDKMTVGKVIAVYTYWNYFMRPTITMGDFYNSLMQAMASCERVFDLLDLKPDIQNKPGAVDMPRPARGTGGHIVFDKVTFGYDPARPVLHNIQLDIPAGKTFALVGATGSGKSSTISLLARFYEYQQGRITIDGYDIRDVTVESLHRQMGLVLQVNYLFTGTIMENIRYPRPNATDDEVYAAAKALGVHDTFMSLPQGYQTDVGERGSSVSLGMRQLICFTRVLLADPSIFLLDEATSSIDTVTESKVQQALEKLVQGRTTVIVAHRLSTITKADCIVVLERGRIIEQGTHMQLLMKKGHYAGLYEKFVSHDSEGAVMESTVSLPRPEIAPGGE